MTLNCSNSGTLTYDDVTNIIEAIVNTEGRKYPIPGLDHEDIAQEIRVECIRVLRFYDPSRIGPSPYKFLQTCIKNFLYNQRRGIWVPNNPPCVRCPLWDKKNKTCMINEIGCEKIVQYRENMALKADLRMPSYIENDISNNTHEQEMDAILLDHSIRATLPEYLITYYDQMLNGQTVLQKFKIKIRAIVNDIINNA